MFKYENNKVLFGLTALLVVSLYIIICDCEIPVIQFNSKIDRYLELIFVHQHADKTFYNIAISYVAAYIFFLLQVYMPTRQNHFRSMTILKPMIESYINSVKLLLTILMQITTFQNNQTNIRKLEELFVVEERENRIFRFTFNESFERLVEKTESTHSEIITNPMLTSMDIRICSVLGVIPQKNIIKLAKYIYTQMQKQNTLPIKGTDIINETNNIILTMEEKYGFIFEKYIVTENQLLIAQYYAGAVNLSMHTINEWEIKVKLN